METIRSQLENESVILENSVTRFKAQWDKLKEDHNEQDGKFGQIIEFIKWEADWMEIKTSREKIM